MARKNISDRVLAVQSARSKRAKTIDMQNRTHVVFPPYDTPLFTKRMGEVWMAKPNRYDIAGLDAPRDSYTGMYDSDFFKPKRKATPKRNAKGQFKKKSTAKKKKSETKIVL